jgi:hypothetical protein
LPASWLSLAKASLGLAAERLSTARRNGFCYTYAHLDFRAADGLMAAGIEEILPRSSAIAAASAQTAL